MPLPRSTTGNESILRICASAINISPYGIRRWTVFPSPAGFQRHDKLSIRLNARHFNPDRERDLCPFRGYLKSLAPSSALRTCFRRREDSSCRRRPASIFARAARPKKTWIPACAGMTDGRVDFQSTNSEPPRFKQRVIQFARSGRSLLSAAFAKRTSISATCPLATALRPRWSAARTSPGSSTFSP